MNGKREVRSIRAPSEDAVAVMANSADVVVLYHNRIIGVVQPVQPSIPVPRPALDDVVAEIWRDHKEATG